MTETLYNGYFITYVLFPTNVFVVSLIMRLMEITVSFFIEFKVSVNVIWPFAVIHLVKE